MKDGGPAFPFRCQGPTTAPELLEALQYVMSAHGEQLTDAFELAQKAIAKATENETT